MINCNVRKLKTDLKAAATLYSKRNCRLDRKNRTYAHTKTHILFSAFDFKIQVYVHACQNRVKNSVFTRRKLKTKWFPLNRATATTAVVNLQCIYVRLVKCIVV